MQDHQEASWYASISSVDVLRHSEGIRCYCFVSFTFQTESDEVPRKGDLCLKIAILRRCAKEESVLFAKRRNCDLQARVAVNRYRRLACSQQTALFTVYRCLLVISWKSTYKDCNEESYSRQPPCQRIETRLYGARDISSQRRPGTSIAHLPSQKRRPHCWKRTPNYSAAERRSC